MKVLFLQDDFPPLSFGGAGFSTFELAIEMIKAGHKIYVVTTCAKDDEVGEYEQNGLMVYRIKSDYHPRFRAYVSLRNKKVLAELESVLERVRPDIVHANNIHTHISYAALKLAKEYSKTVFTARDTMTFSYDKFATERYLKSFDQKVTWLDNLKSARKRWNPLRNFFIRKYLRSADKIFAISYSLKEAMEKNGIKDVSVIYNGINVDEWSVGEDKVKEFKSKFKIEGKKVIFFNGRLSPEKGSEVTMKMFEIVKKEEPESLLLVAGKHDGPGIAGVVFTGWLDREDMKVAYGVADVVIMPSIYLDAFGRVNIEAMASKKPVVGTCYGGTPEIVVDGVTGYIVNPQYPKEMAEKVIDLLQDQTKAEKFGQAGYERAKQFFNLKDKANEYVSVYNRIINEKR